MLTLTLLGQPIPVSLDFSMQLTWKSPVTAFDKIPSGYGLGMSFPINEYTRALFGNPERFAKYRAGNDQKFPGFEVRFSGVLLMSGTLSITGASHSTGSGGGGGNYEASLIDQVGVLGEKEQERDILDILQWYQIYGFDNKSLYDPDEDEYCCFPIRNTGFFKDKGLIIEDKRMVTDPNNANHTIEEKYDVELLTYLFELDANVKSKVNALNEDGTIQLNEASLNLYANPHVGSINVVTPFFFLNNIIGKVLKASDFYITDENYLKTHPALKNLCIYNPYDITAQTFQVAAFIIGSYYENEGQVRSRGLQIEAYIRQYYSPLVVLNNHLPKMKVGDLLLSTQNLLNVCFHILPNNTVNVFSRESILSGEAIDLEKYFFGNWDIGMKMNVALKFVREHDDKDMIFSERFTDLSDRKTDIKASVLNWDALDDVSDPDTGEIRYLETEKIYAEYKWISQSIDDLVTKKAQTVDVLGWEEISIGFQNGWYKYGREEVEEIKTSWSTTHGDYFLPEVNQLGNMKAWKSKAQSFSPRLLFYQPDNQDGKQRGNNYSNGFMLDDQLHSAITMEYENAGLFQTSILFEFWKNWNPFWANRLPVTGTFDLPVNVLQYIVYNICQKYRTREGEFLIDEMSCTLYIDHISETTVKGFKVE